LLLPCSQPWLISEICIFCFYLFHEYDCVVSSLQPLAARSGLSMDMRTITLFAASWLSSKSWWNIFILVHSLSVKISCNAYVLFSVHRPWRSNSMLHSKEIPKCGHRLSFFISYSVLDRSGSRDFPTFERKGNLALIILQVSWWCYAFNIHYLVEVLA